VAVRGRSVRALQRRFPSEEACLDELMRVRFGNRLRCVNCKKPARYYRVRARRSFECEHCGHQVYPTAGTPFASTRTPLRSWFHVMLMFCVSRNGATIAEVQRELGVTYKTAWRMCHLIRKYWAPLAATKQSPAPARRPQA
jgi:transposase